jgi:NAD(P)-dependent dehydrogenase (short-subunit alcohol dehydrogenase family)
MGRASAHLFAKEGAAVFIAGRSEERGEEQAKKINDEGGKAFFLELDITNQHEWDAAVEDVKKQAGALHILMNIVGSNAMSMFPDVEVGARRAFTFRRLPMLTIEPPQNPGISTRQG